LKEELDILLVLGIALASGLIGAKIFKRLKLPQVVGYILMGAIIGTSGFGMLHHDLVDTLTPVSNFALGIIGFMIGGELKLSVFRKMGRSIFTILFAEVLISFGCVVLTVWIITGELHIALIFGALATATAPAATVDVLWEYKSSGVLSTTILAIVGLDDALALIVYGFASAYAKMLIVGGSNNFSIAEVLYKPLLEIFGSMLLGIVIGAAAEKLSGRMRDDNQYLTLVFCSIMICCGISVELHLSQILACMFMGMTLANWHPRSSERAIRVLDRTTTPIYILFFVMIGAKLNILLLPEIGLLGAAYIAARSVGKVSGVYIGASISKAEDVVRKYLGVALFSQAGIAIGLSIAIAQEFSRINAAGQELGTLVINVIAGTTFIVQIIGPPCVKYSITKAGEVGKADKKGIK